MKANAHEAGRATGGFTLVELLTVVTIIGLLLAILMPTLQQARRSADRTGCATNLRTIGVAVHQYHDHHGRYPGPTNARQGFGNRGYAPNSSYLAQNLYPWLGAPEYQPWMRDTELRVMRCPAHRRLMGPADSPDYPHPQYAICYIANRAGLEGGHRPFGSNNSPEPGAPFDQGDRSSWQQPLPMIRVVNHSRYWAVMDADSQIYLDSLGRERRILLAHEPPFIAVHGDVRNALFLDGHVAPNPAIDGPPPNPPR